jgi:hypothetical protein
LRGGGAGKKSDRRDRRKHHLQTHRNPRKHERLLAGVRRTPDLRKDLITGPEQSPTCARRQEISAV